MDRNHENNSRENFVGLCPNHHRLLHDSRYSAETEALILEKLKTGAQTDGNYLQYCKNQSGEKIADGDGGWSYGIAQDCGA
jgi:hypothetical protein